MVGIESETIKGFNSYIQKQKKNNVRVTTVLFDDEWELLHDRVPIKDLKKLTEKEYFVRGMTALLDGIGKTINYFQKEKNNKLIFIITTDGLENASKEFTKKQINQLIKKHSNWEFIYIGANIDSYAEAGGIGIRKTNIANYIQEEKGVELLFKSVGEVTDNLYLEGKIDLNWKDDLEKYIEENKDNK
ncbi:MAG: hypothetical protein GX864_04460, partial [Mollicutes bacterium]|nr:hypothetical protein [Mollicutes bacterium]